MLLFRKSLDLPFVAGGKSFHLEYMNHNIRNSLVQRGRQRAVGGEGACWLTVSGIIKQIVKVITGKTGYVWLAGFFWLSGFLLSAAVR